MLLETVYIQEGMEATGRLQKAMESDRSKEKVMEPYGSLQKTRESSIGKLGKRVGKRSGVKYEIGKEKLGKEGGSP